MSKGNMNPVNVGSIPPEANSRGSLNETVSQDVREGGPEPKRSKGPRRGEQGEYQPATYPTKTPGCTRTDC
jgi:hypothetical protein